MLDRREFIGRLLVGRGDLLVVCGLGSATYDVAAAGDHPLNFYLWGAMGGTAMIGLGLALARPDRRVAVITGDGDMLMGLGSLATIGVRGAKILRSWCSTMPIMAKQACSRATPMRGSIWSLRRLPAASKPGARSHVSKRLKMFVPCCMAAWGRSSSTHGSRRRTCRAYCRCATDTRSNSGSLRRWVPHKVPCVSVSGGE